MPKYVDDAGLARFWDNIQDQIGSASQAQVDAWLDEHPEATTTVQDGAVTTVKLADGAVTGAKIASDTITKDKFAVNAVTATCNLISGRLERGGITTSGVDDDRAAQQANRVRTKGFIEFDEECNLWVRIKSGYKLAFVIYNSDGTFYRDDYWYTSANHGEFGFSNCDGFKARVVLAYSDDAAISDVMEFENAAVIERRERNAQSVTDGALTYGAIRSTGADIIYTSYPYICRTNMFVRPRHGTLRMAVASGFTATMYTYTAARVFESKTDAMAAGAYELAVSTSKLYRFAVGRVDTAQSLSPADASNALQVTDVVVTSGQDEIDWTDEDARLAQQLRYSSDGTTVYTNLTLLHFSDMHGDGAELERIMRCRDENLPLVDDVICTGDILSADWANDFTYWDAAGAQGVLIALGNHDEIVDRSNWNSASSYKTMAECYARYMAPNIATWGVTYEADKTYYYKDYTNVRLIVLDLVQDDIVDDATQLAWFESTLAGARTAGKAVVVAEHYPPTNRAGVSGAGAWYDSHYSYEQPGRWMVRGRWQAAVSDFVTAGGEFVCWLVGHTHADLLCYNTTYPDQFFVCIDCANPVKAMPYSDTGRAIGTPTQDLFNVLGIDTVNKTVRVMRVGASENMFMQQKKMLCFNYATHTVVG